MDNEKIDKAMQEALWHIDAEFEKLGWDLPALPMVLVVLKAEGEHEGRQYAAFLMEELSGWDITRSKTNNIQAALSFLAEIYAGTPEGQNMAGAYKTRGEVYGVALVSEAWMLRGVRHGDEDLPDDYQHGDLAKHPDRIEVRIVHIAPVNGPSAELEHERDGIAEIWVDGHEGRELGGQLPRLLKHLAKAFA